MDYLSQVSMLFGCVSLIETGVVMFLFHQHTNDWHGALSPQGLRCCCGGGKGRAAAASEVQRTKSLVYRGASDDVKLRHQTYSQIFFTVDDNYDGLLDFDEISHFGEFAMGRDWNRQLCVDFLAKYDTNKDQKMGLDEFAMFCEEVIYGGKSVEFIQQRADGFLALLDRQEEKRKEMWQARAHKVDVAARWTIPTGFLLFVMVLYSMGEEHLANLATNDDVQALIYIVGLIPTLASMVGGCLLTCYRVCTAASGPPAGAVMRAGAAVGATVTEQEPLTSQSLPDPESATAKTRGGGQREEGTTPPPLPAQRLSPRRPSPSRLVAGRKDLAGEIIPPSEAV
eukprot:SAG22_NODE_6_length_41368_cov_49.702222_17_plen_340_part_00